jgi:hypothetical protein
MGNQVERSREPPGREFARARKKTDAVRNSDVRRIIGLPALFLISRRGFQPKKD